MYAVIAKHQKCLGTYNVPDMEPNISWCFSYLILITTLWVGVSPDWLHFIDRKTEPVEQMA